MVKKAHAQDHNNQNVSSTNQDLQEEIEILEQQQAQQEQDSQEQSQTDASQTVTDEVARLTEILTRTQADYQNFKMRTERDNEQMIFFFQEKIFKKILPRVDDLERILKNTPENEQQGTVYEWVVALHKTFLRDLSALWVTPYNSIGEAVNVDFHEVMTQIPVQTPEQSGKIIEEFEKWYLLWDKVLRVAKVIVGV